MINTIQDLTERANMLKELRSRKETMYQAYKEVIDPVEADMERLNQEILEGFHTLGLKNIRLESGENYTMAVKKGLEVTDESLALRWAVENKAVSIDKRLAAQKLKEVTEAPQGFKFIEREEVRVTKAKTQE